MLLPPMCWPPNFWLPTLLLRLAAFQHDFAQLAGTDLTELTNPSVVAPAPYGLLKRGLGLLYSNGYLIYFTTTEEIETRLSATLEEPLLGGINDCEDEGWSHDNRHAVEI